MVNFPIPTLLFSESVTHLERLGPIDRTNETSGSGKNGPEEVLLKYRSFWTSLIYIVNTM